MSWIEFAVEMLFFFFNIIVTNRILRQLDRYFLRDE